MTDIARLNKLFFDNTGMERKKVESIISDSLNGADDGELFLEYRQSESFSFDDGKLKAATLIHRKDLASVQCLEKQQGMGPRQH